jgi:TRAP-type C4-dicarboxylate transport system substrate-binding protein
VRKRLDRVVPAAIAALLALTASGCLGGGGGDRAGGAKDPETVVLTLAGHEEDPAVGKWIAAVERLSHGSLRIEMRDGWRADEVDYEKGTIADVRAGKVDLASIPARAYDALGVTSFQALLAPFLVDSYALERRVLAGGLPDRMLSGLDPLGVAGVAVLPGGLQKVLSFSRPLLAPTDYRTATTRESIGIRPSTLAASTFRALRAGHAELAPGGDTSQIAAVESDLAGIVTNRYQALTAGETLAANVNLWPRITSIVANEKALAALSGDQRTALRTAGRAALGPSMARLVRDERTALGTICRPPGRKTSAFFFLTASARDRAAFLSAVRPVYRELARDRATQAAIATIGGLKRQGGAEASPRCRGARAAPAGTLRVAGELTAVSPSRWSGTVTSSVLGRGHLALTREVRLRTFVTGTLLRLVARFPSGELRGCLAVSITPSDRTFRWTGPGVIQTTSPALRSYEGLSLRFAGVTRTSDLGHVRGGLISDAPSGLPCDYNEGV